MDTPQVTSPSARVLDGPSVSQPHLASGNRASWLAVSSVAIGSFAFVATEYMPVGLLPQIAADLHVTAGTAGLMVTTPGVVAALSAPTILLAAGRINRRAILLCLALLLLVSNVVAATAPNFTVMLLGRVFLGMGLGGFWTVALGASGQLVQARHAARASAIIFTGITLATVIGVPLGTLIAQLTSWRMAFFATAGLAAAALGAQAILLPAIPPKAAMKLSDFAAMLSRSQVRRSLLLVLFQFGAHFAAYTYIAPFLERNASLPASWITPILFGFGVVGFMSNLGISAIVSRRLKESLFGLGALLMLAMVALPLLQASRASVVAAVLVWGIAYGAIPLCLSVWMQMTSPDHPEAGSSLFVSTVQVAIAAGSLGGGAVVDHIGVAATMQTGAFLALTSLFLILTFRRDGATLADLLRR